MKVINEALSEGKELTNKQVTALTAWMNWYSKRLGRIIERHGNSNEDYSGYEQDLFEAFGCETSSCDV